MVPHAQRVCASCSRQIFACASLARALRELMRAYICIDVDTYVCTYVHTYVHTCIYTCVHTYILAETQMYGQIRTRTICLREPCASLARVRVSLYVYAYIRIYVHTYMHIHLQTYIQTYRHTADSLARVACA